MSKSTYFTGQPVYSQVIKLLVLLSGKLQNSRKIYCCPLNFKTTRFPYPQRPSIGVADSFFEK